MTYFLLPLTIILSGINGVCLKFFQEKIQRGSTSVFLFLSVGCFLSALFSFLMSDGAIPSTTALIFGVILGFFSFTANLCVSKAYEKGPASLITIIANMGIFFPIVYSFFAYGENISLIQYIGLAFMLLSVIFSGLSNKDTALRKQLGFLWLILAVATMLSCGVIQVLQKEYQIITGGTNANSIVTVSGITSSILFLSLFLFKNRKTPSNEKHFSSMRAFFTICVIFALSGMLSQVTFLLLNTKIPAVILYPCNSGGVALISTLVFIFAFKEKLGLKKLLSLFFGLCSIVLLAI